MPYGPDRRRASTLPLRLAAASARSDADFTDLCLSNSDFDPVWPRRRADTGAYPPDTPWYHLGTEAVDEAGQAFGATKLLWKVEIPAALPNIMVGITQCIMLSLSMVVIAALVAADGLGKPVVRALNTVNIPMGFEAGTARNYP
jgi:hypothetical protein